MTRNTLIITVLASLSAANILAETNTGPMEFQWTFRGLCYQTNAAGKIISTAVTDKTLLREKAAAAGITDLKSLALVYHIKGDVLGDTVDVINATNGAVLGEHVLGFYFGDYDRGQNLGRMALTNSAVTEVRRIDYIYTPQNGHSMGSAFTTKRYRTNHNGTVTTTIGGPIFWLILPEGTNGQRICSGTYMLGKPLF